MGTADRHTVTPLCSLLRFGPPLFTSLEMLRNPNRKICLCRRKKDFFDPVDRRGFNLLHGREPGRLRAARCRLPPCKTPPSCSVPFLSQATGASLVFACTPARYYLPEAGRGSSTAAGIVDQRDIPRVANQPDVLGEQFAQQFTHLCSKCSKILAALKSSSQLRGNFEPDRFIGSEK